MKFRLVEGSELYKGVFWIVDLDNMDNNRQYCFTIPSDADGNTTDINNLEHEINAKSGNTYNHEKLWSELPSKLTHNKKYNYYPRGRVQIINGRADIYLNPNIITDEIIDFIKKEFNLTQRNGINNIRIMPDGSNHYKCYLDD